MFIFNINKKSIIKSKQIIMKKIIKYNNKDSVNFYDNLRNSTNSKIMKSSSNNSIELFFGNMCITLDELKLKYLNDLFLQSLSIKRIKYNTDCSLINTKILFLCSDKNKVENLDFINKNMLEDLSLLFYKKVRDISSFKNLKKLELINCPKIKNIINLLKLEHLEITGCKNITDIGTLRNLKYLKLDTVPYNANKLNIDYQRF